MTYIFLNLRENKNIIYNQRKLEETRRKKRKRRKKRGKKEKKGEKRGKLHKIACYSLKCLLQSKIRHKKKFRKKQAIITFIPVGLILQRAEG